MYYRYHIPWLPANPREIKQSMPWQTVVNVFVYMLLWPPKQNSS